mgnify:CR=1 FL=1
MLELADEEDADRPRVPRLRPGVDLQRLDLNRDEAFLVTRVDGKTPVPKLALLVGKTQEEVGRMVDRLVKSGVLVMGEPEVQAPVRDPYGGFTFDPEALAEDVDLDEAEKKRILYTHARLDRMTPYELLGLRFGEDVEKVREAFRERSKVWHPDRIRRPRLGSYKARIDQVFQALQRAKKVLTDKETKKAYDREHGPSFDESDMSAFLKEKRREDRAAAREAESVRSRKERNPFILRRKESKKLFELARQYKQSGDLIEALRYAQAARAKYDCPEHAELMFSLQKETAELRVTPLLNKGKSAESMTDWDVALRMYAEAVKVAPEHGKARLRLARCLVESGRPIEKVNEHVQKAVELLPDEPEAHYVRGLAYHKGGMDKAAIPALERAVKLKPNYTEAKRLLRKLKLGF